MKNLCSGTQCEGFQFMLILDLWGISFHTVVVFGLGKNLLFKYVLGHCVYTFKKLFEKKKILTASKKLDWRILYNFIFFAGHRRAKSDIIFGEHPKQTFGLSYFVTALPAFINLLLRLLILKTFFFTWKKRYQHWRNKLGNVSPSECFSLSF